MGDQAEKGERGDRQSNPSSGNQRRREGGKEESGEGYAPGHSAVRDVSALVVENRANSCQNIAECNTSVNSQMSC